mgnify:CR=1 FL=1
MEYEERGIMESALELSGGDSLEDVLADADAVFGWNDSVTYKARAHEYLVKRNVGRSPGDTAVQCTVKDLVRRAGSGERLDRDEISHMRMKLAEVERELFSLERRL